MCYLQTLFSSRRAQRRIFITCNQSNCTERFVACDPSPYSGKVIVQHVKVTFYRFALAAVAFFSSPFPRFLGSFIFFPQQRILAATERKWRYVNNAFALNLLIARRGERSHVHRSHLHGCASHKLPRTSVPFTKLSLDESNRLITIYLPCAVFYSGGAAIMWDKL